jgi:hypothetical protein
MSFVSAGVCPRRMLSCATLCWFVLTAIVFVVHVYSLRFVFLVGVGIGFGWVHKACSGFPQRLIAPVISRTLLSRAYSTLGMLRFWRSAHHTFRQYLYWLALCYRWVVSGVDACLSRNLYIQLHHKMHRLTTVRLFAQGESLALWLSVRCHLCSFCMFAAAVSLDLHTVWRSVSGRLLRNGTGGVGSQLPCNMFSRVEPLL